MKDSNPDRTRRKQAESRGRWSEFLAETLLRLKGYRILHRRLKTPLGEVDLIARKGRLICFVEVKHRVTRGQAVHSLQPRQAQRIERAASWWFSRRPDLHGCDLRFDLIATAPGKVPSHIPDAWRPL